jgi:hypothetical protein
LLIAIEAKEGDENKVKFHWRHCWKQVVISVFFGRTIRGLGIAFLEICVWKVFNNPCEEILTWSHLGQAFKIIFAMHQCLLFSHKASGHGGFSNVLREEKVAFFRNSCIIFQDDFMSFHNIRDVFQKKTQQHTKH